MDEEYKEKFRNAWRELMEKLSTMYTGITISDAYHVVKMCVKCDMTLDDFWMWGIEK